MNYKTTVFLSIALGAVLLIAAIAGMRYMNPAPEGYSSSFETAKEQTTPQPPHPRSDAASTTKTDRRAVYRIL